MQIQFDPTKPNQDMEFEKSTQKVNVNSGIQWNPGYITDIKGKVTDDKSLIVQGRTTKDVLEQATKTDVDAQSDYLLLMSHSMSSNDFSDLMKEGFDVLDLPAKTSVTLSDKMKVTLAKSGTIVEGYTDTLSMEELNAITKSPALSQELRSSFIDKDAPLTKEHATKAMQLMNQSKELKPLTPQVKEYMVSNQQEASIPNLYKAQYSVQEMKSTSVGEYFYQDQNGYYGKAAYNNESSEMDATKLQNYLEEVVISSGVELNQQTLEEANWLLEKGILLQPANLQKIHQLNQLVLPPTAKQVFECMAAAISSYGVSEKMVLGSDKTIYELGVELEEKVNLLPAEVVLPDQKTGMYNLNTVFYYQSIQQSIQDESLSSKEIQATRQIQEIRLRMSAQVNISMLRQGISIDLMPLQELVEQLKSAEQEIASNLFYENEETAISNYHMFEETLSLKSEILSAPMGFVASFQSYYEFSATLSYSQIASQAASQKNQYELANKQYETFMSQPKREYGDTIQKAFQNIDEILSELGQEAIEENRRVIRIMAYADMSVSSKQFQDVKEADQLLSKVIAALTPAKTLGLIKNQINPLEMTLEKLEEALYKTDDSTHEFSETGDDTSQYAQFLYELEQSDQVTDTEKQAYIGVYRLFRQIEKDHRSSIGKVVESQRELNLENMLEAVRTNQQDGIDIRLQEGESFQQRVLDQTKSITEQMNQYFQSEKALLAQVTTQEIEYLLENGHQVTPKNLDSMKYFQKNKSKIADTIAQVINPKENNFVELLDEPVQFQEKWDDFLEETKDTLDSLIKSQGGQEGQEYTMDIRELANTFKQVSFMQNASKEQSYEIPIQVGEIVQLIHLKINQNNQQKELPNVVVKMESIQFGFVEGTFYQSKTSIEGTVKISRYDQTTLFNKSMEEVKLKMKEATELDANITLQTTLEKVVQNYFSDFDSTLNPENTKSNTILFKTAKTFIEEIVARDSVA